MNAVEIQDKVVQVVRRITDTDFLLYLYEMLEAKAADDSENDILDELNETQRSSILQAIEKVEAGGGVAHTEAIRKLRNLLK